LEDGHLKLEKIHTSQNLADMFKKGVTKEKLSSSLVLVGIQHEGEDEKFSMSRVDYSIESIISLDLL
jgi:hypothetical protein